MAFDWRSFGTGVFETLEAEIDEKSAEAKAFKEREYQSALRNQSLIQTRDSRAKQAAAYGKQALQLMGGKANPEAMKIVQTAMASGMGNVQELYEKLNAAANMPGQVGGLSSDDIEAIIDMPTMPDTVYEDYADKSLLEFAQLTYGAKPTGSVATPTSDVGMLGTLFGYDDMNRAKRELSKEQFGSGMSISEINALAAGSDYQSLIPNATMTFKDAELFGFDAQGDFSKDISAAMVAALELNESKIQRVMLGSQNEEGDIVGGDPQAAVMLRKQVSQKAAKLVVDRYVERYIEAGILENEYALQQIKDSAPEGYVNDLLLKYGKITQEEYDAAKAAAEGGAAVVPGPIPAVVPEGGDGSVDPITELTEGSVEKRPQSDVDPTDLNAPTDSSAQEEWDRKYKDKYDPATGAPIVVEKRPDISETRTERRLSGREYEVSLYREWNEKYGETHDPETGLPLPVEE